MSWDPYRSQRQRPRTVPGPARWMKRECGGRFLWKCGFRMRYGPDAPLFYHFAGLWLGQASRLSEWLKTMPRPRGLM